MIFPVHAGGVARTRRLIVAITAAHGAGYAVRLLQVLRDLGVETHLIIGEDAQRGFDEATDQTGSPDALASQTYQPSNQAARISSGSFLVDGMLVVPCAASFATAIAYGVGDSLIHRAADVTIKEGRPLGLLVLSQRLSPMARENFRKLESIRGVSVIEPMSHGLGGEDIDTREGAQIDLLLRAVGIEREG
jgi:polyprenyl P-hydroxybenzoate/phenylacrylic acid decarboxylase-like protein